MTVQYEDISILDLKRANAMFKIDDWNASARFCQQVVEKHFKAIIELEGEVADLPILSVHKLNILGMRLSKIRKLTLTKNLLGDMMTLTAYYYDTNYPGKNYIQLDKNMAEDALSSVDELLKWAGPVKRNTQNSEISTDPLK